MKNLAFALAFILSLVGVSAVAKPAVAKGSSTLVSQQFFNSLQLTEYQYIKIKALEKIKEIEMRDAEAVATGDDLVLFEADVQDRFETGLLQLLTPAQKQAYATYKATQLTKMALVKK